MLSMTTLQVADQIRPIVEKYEQAFPALLEIPSKDHPYGALLVYPHNLAELGEGTDVRSEVNVTQTRAKTRSSSASRSCSE